MTNAPIIFDDALLQKHRARALRALNDDSLFLWNELAGRLTDRLGDIRRDFPYMLEIGSHHGGLKEKLAGKHGITQHIQQEQYTSQQASHHVEANQEQLPIKPYSMDLVVSIASLHWVNDLPGCLMQCLHALKPDGVFLALIPGEQTLYELRESLDAAMLECSGGISPRVSPMLTMQDASALTQRAGFALPMIDRERIDVSYSSPMKLLYDLRAMGQTNALMQRSGTPLTKRIVEKTCAHYAEHFKHPEGGVCATFDIITITGWAPEKSQPKPLARGSAELSMKDILSN